MLFSSLYKTKEVAVLDPGDLKKRQFIRFPEVAGVCDEVYQVLCAQISHASGRLEGTGSSSF